MPRVSCHRLTRVNQRSHWLPVRVIELTYVSVYADFSACLFKHFVAVFGEVGLLLACSGTGLFCAALALSTLFCAALALALFPRCSRLSSAALVVGYAAVVRCTQDGQAQACGQ